MLRLLTSAVAVSLLALAVAQTNNFVCPDNNGQTVTDASGVQYVVGCTNDTGNSAFTQGTVTNGFNDCLTTCSTNSLGSCTGFTYQGGANGVGSGYCYYKSNTPESFMSGNINDVSMIKSAYLSSAFVCPDDNNMVVTDPSGIQYIIGCGTDTSFGSYASRTSSVGFNDCFFSCSNGTYPTTEGSGHCTGFTYVGGIQGQGGGTCYFKNIIPESFEGSNSNFVAAIQYAAYPAASSSSSSSTPASAPPTVTYTTYGTQTVTSTLTTTYVSSYPVTTTAVSSYYVTTTVVSSYGTTAVSTYTTSYTTTATVTSTYSTTATVTSLITTTVYSSYPYTITQTTTQPASSITQTQTQSAPTVTQTMTPPASSVTQTTTRPASSITQTQTQTQSASTVVQTTTQPGSAISGTTTEIDTLTYTTVSVSPGPTVYVTVGPSSVATTFTTTTTTSSSTSTSRTTTTPSSTSTPSSSSTATTCPSTVTVTYHMPTQPLVTTTVYV